VRNNVKQFLHLVLPKEATLWSVFVAGKPVKPAKDKNGSILIPLEKSQLSGENLAQFPVEIVYLDKVSKMRFLGMFKLRLPQTDIPVSSLSWQVYLPLDYAYLHFGGDVKESRGEFGRRRFAVVAKMADVVSQQVSRQYQESLSQVVQNEEMLEARVKGVLPIKINIPEEGRLYQFSKLLVTEKESPRLSVWYMYGIKQVYGFIRLIVFLGILFLVFKLIRKIFKAKLK
jgi:hypothetical protein